MASLLRTLRDRGLFEPSPSVDDVGDRRKMRLLSILGFTQALLVASGAVNTRIFDPSEAGRITSGILAIAIAPYVAIYLLGRSRYTRSATWFSLIALISLPLCILLATRHLPSAKPFESLVYLLSSVIVASFMVTARGTALVGAMGMGCAIATGLYAQDWSAEAFHGAQFLLVHAGLIVVFKVHRDRLEEDRAAELRARNSQLLSLQRTLEDRIEERTLALRSQTDAMRQVLDNVDQGLFSVDADGAVASEMSAALVRWFGQPRQGEPFWEYFGRVSGPLAAELEIGWLQLAEGFLPREVALQQLPKRFESNGRTYALSFSPIQASTGYLVVISDITAEVERARLDQDRDETVALFDHALADRAAVAAFFDQGDGSMARVLGSLRPDAVELRRIIHTLKGNAALLDLRTLASVCHDIESELETCSAPTKASVARLNEVWTRLRAKVERFVLGREETIHLTRAEHAAFYAALRAGCPRDDALAQEFATFALEPVERRLHYFELQAHRIAARLGKAIAVVVDHDPVRLCPARWNGLWAALVHAVRNALDHGIEPGDERALAGKPARGKLSLSVRCGASSVIVAVEDDGRGVDWDAVRRSASHRGLACETRDDLVAALFAGGVSTAREVSDLSGRGVGMGALRSAVEMLGGNLKMISRQGQGTRLELVVPQAAVGQRDQSALDVVT